MIFERSFIPYGSGWSTPFVKWQGSLAGLHPLKLAAECAARALARRNLSPQVIDQIVLGWTVPSPQCFYGAPWVAGLLGAPHATGPMVMQACATSVRALVTAGDIVFNGEANGWYKAYDARTGKELWKYYCGAGVNSPGVSYIVRSGRSARPWNAPAPARSVCGPRSTGRTRSALWPMA